MKFFAYIFSIYILALSVMPCSDASNDCRSKTEVAERADAHSHKSDHNDTCSPFCTCTCCGTTASTNLGVYKLCIKKTPVSSKITFPRRDFVLVSNFYGNIWQPPEINA